jgi:hypothetical protein
MEHAIPFLEFPWDYEPSELHFPISLPLGRKALLLKLLSKFNSYITQERTWMHGGLFPFVNYHHIGSSFGRSEMLGKKLNLLKLMKFPLIQSLKSWPILEIDHCMRIYLLKYDSETTGNILDAVEVGDFEPKRQNLVFISVMLAQRAGTRPSEFSSCCCMCCSVRASSLGWGEII